MIEVTQEDTRLLDQIFNLALMATIKNKERDDAPFLEVIARYRVECANAAEQRGMIAARDAAVVACIAERLYEPHVAYDTAVNHCIQAIATMPMTAGGDDAD